MITCQKIRFLGQDSNWELQEQKYRMLRYINVFGDTLFIKPQFYDNLPFLPSCLF